MWRAASRVGWRDRLAISRPSDGARIVLSVVLEKGPTGGRRGGLVRHWERRDS